MLFGYANGKISYNVRVIKFAVITNEKARLGNGLNDAFYDRQEQL